MESSRPGLLALYCVPDFFPSEDRDYLPHFFSPHTESGASGTSIDPGEILKKIILNWSKCLHRTKQLILLRLTML